MRVIEVPKCKDCPRHRKEIMPVKERYLVHSCRTNENLSRIITTPELEKDFPDWCPLKEVLDLIYLNEDED